jgi:dTDP-4-dehydrorhamnose reductase
MIIGITGMSGFLGNALAAASQRRGYKAIRIALPRTQEIKDVNYIHQLLMPLKVDAIIHTAISRHPKSELNEYLNAEFPARLEQTFRLINKNGIFMHISSINVLVNNLQDKYTKAKRTAEMQLSRSQAITIRPSLIWSWQGKGDAKRLEEYIAGKLFAFMVYPGNIHLPILIDDLAEKLVDLIEDNNKNKIFNIVGDTPCSVWELAKFVSRKYKKWLIPIPTMQNALFLPKPLRTINYTQFEYSVFPKPDQVITLPFKLS